MVDERSKCPPRLSEIAEAYVMGTISRMEAAGFEEHLLVCTRCTAAVADVYNYDRAARIAAQRLRPVKTLHAAGQ